MNQVLQNDLNLIINQNLLSKNISNKTFLISGASGFIASHIIKTLLAVNDERGLNIRVIGIVRNEQKAKRVFGKLLERSDLKLIYQDVCEPIRNIKEKIDIIIHAASIASPKYFKENPVGTIGANIFGTKNLLDLAVKKKVENFLFISSGEVYGQLTKKQLPTNEKSYGYIDLLDIRSCYPESKRMGEAMCVAWCYQYQVPTKIVRLFHTYGPGIDLADGRVFADFTANIINNQNIEIKGDGKAVRSFCYIADAVAGIFTVLFKGKNGEAYNITNDKAAISIKNLAKLFVSLYPEKKLKVVMKQRKKTDQYIRSPIQINDPDISKIRSLGWQPQYGLKEGFKKMVDSFLT